VEATDPTLQAQLRLAAHAKHDSANIPHKQKEIRGDPFKPVGKEAIDDIKHRSAGKFSNNVNTSTRAFMHEL